MHTSFLLICCLFFFFFFQAEDGIRDRRNHGPVLALRRSGVGVHLCLFLPLVRSAHDRRSGTRRSTTTFATHSYAGRTRNRSHARQGAAAPDQALPRGLGMVIRPQHRLLSRRLLWVTWL